MDSHKIHLSQKPETRTLSQGVISRPGVCLCVREGSASAEVSSTGKKAKTDS